VAGADAEFLIWHPGSGLTPGTGLPGRLLAADSWLVEADRVRDLDLHRQRFSAIGRDPPHFGDRQERPVRHES
jgi:hypothetical protein